MEDAISTSDCENTHLCSIFDSNKMGPLFSSAYLWSTREAAHSFPGECMWKGNNDTPAPTHPHRVLRNPLKVGGQGDEERSRMNIKGGFGSGQNHQMEASTGWDREEENKGNIRKTQTLRRRWQKRLPQTVTGGSKRDTARHSEQAWAPMTRVGPRSCGAKEAPAPALLDLSTNMLRHQSARHVQHLSAAAFLGPVSHSCFTDDRLMCPQKL